MIVLYAITDIAKALIKVLKDQPIEIKYIDDRNTKLEKLEQHEVRKPLCKNLSKTKEPILVSLVACHGEMEEFLRHQGYQGDILCLDEILEALNRKMMIASKIQAGWCDQMYFLEQHMVILGVPKNHTTQIFKRNEIGQ